MRPSERLAYSPIAGRAPLKLPGGARMVVWTIVNVEEWDIDRPMPRTVLTPPAGGVPKPDIPNWAWHEYGNRVGFWRMLELLDELMTLIVAGYETSAGTLNWAWYLLARHPEIHDALVLLDEQLYVDPVTRPHDDRRPIDGAVRLEDWRDESLRHSFRSAEQQDRLHGVGF